MRRIDLLDELERCATAHGMAFRQGLPHEINSRLTGTPELWCEPPSLARRQGRSEGVMEYRVTVNLVCPAKSAREKEKCLGELEEALSAIMVSMCGNDHVAGMPQVGYTTGENILTNRGEVSLKAILTIKTRI